MFRCMWTKSLFPRCKTGLHWCKTGLHWCKRLLGDLFSRWLKHLLHPLVATLGNSQVSGLCSRHSGSQCNYICDGDDVSGEIIALSLLAILSEKSKGGVPQAYVHTRALSATLCSVHVSRVFLCISMIGEIVLE